MYTYTCLLFKYLIVIADKSHMTGILLITVTVHAAVDHCMARFILKL